MFLGFQENGDSRLIENLSYRYAEGHSLEIDQAKVYSIKWLSWAEARSLGLLPATEPDRLVCGRMRMLAQTSTRREIDDHFGERAFRDMSNWDLGPPSGQAETNHIRFLMIKARDSDGGGAFCKLFRAANAKSDVQCGIFEAASPVRDQQGQAGIGQGLHQSSQSASLRQWYSTPHLRNLASQPGGMGSELPQYGLVDSVVSAFRHHGAKCTIPTLAQFLGLNWKNVKSGKYHRADEDHPELVLPACHAGKYIMNV